MRPAHPNMEEMDLHFSRLPVVERCMFCEWEWSGQAGEGRERALQHRLGAHPEVRPVRRRPGRHLKSFRQPKLRSEDWVDIDSERRRRALLTGVDLSAVVE